MIKKLLITFVVLVLVLAGILFFFGGPFLNKSIRNIVVDYGPRFTGTPVHLEAVDLSPFGGSGRISGFVVGNPEGFSTDHAISVGQMEVDLVPTSLFGDAIMIHRIAIQSPSIVVEQVGQTSNLQQIQRNIAEATATESPEPDEDPAEARKLAIGELTIENASVHILAFGQDRQVTLPTIRLTELGTEEGGLPPGEIAIQVLHILLRHVGEEATAFGIQFLQDPEGNLNAFREQLEQLQNESGEGGLEGAARGLRNLLENRRESNRPANGAPPTPENPE